MEVINEVESDECDDDNHGYYKKYWVNKYVRGRRIQFVNTKRRREMRAKLSWSVNEQPSLQVEAI